MSVRGIYSAVRRWVSGLPALVAILAPGAALLAGSLIARAFGDQYPLPTVVAILLLVAFALTIFIGRLLDLALEVGEAVVDVRFRRAVHRASEDLKAERAAGQDA